MDKKHIYQLPMSQPFEWYNSRLLSIKSPSDEPCKAVEVEITRRANCRRIQDVSERLKEAVAALRKVHEDYESKVDDTELEEAQEYADRFEEEHECRVMPNIKLYITFDSIKRKTL